MQHPWLQRLFRSLFALSLALPVSVHAQNGKPDGKPTKSLKPVTVERLLKGTEDSSGWLMYGGNYQNWRFSPLKDINRQNIKKLQVAWIFQTGIPGQLEAAPIIADGILYLTSSYSHLYALDAATGEPLWKYDHPLPDDLRICCGPTNRGVAIVDDKVFMATLDAHLVALDRKTGTVAWNTKMDDYTVGYSSTAAPLVIKDKVIIGIAGGEYGARGFIDAYDAKTGERKWRRYTIPAAGEKGVETWAGDSWKNGGGPAWVTGSYDAEQNILYWATGNASPDWNGDSREGDNLYTNSVLALDPDTGELKWHFQFTPHDVWDYDGNTGMFLVSVQRSGQEVKALAQPNRNGFLYVLDRTSGKYLHSAQYVDKLNWAKGLDENGKPKVDQQYVPMPGGNKEFICPGNVGGQNGAFTAAYSPVTKYIYVPVIESCGKMEKSTAIFIQGIPFWGGGPGAMQGDDQSSYGHLSAIDPTTGSIKWRYVDDYPLVGGTLATAGGLVFTGNQHGYAMAFDDTTGELLWQFQTGSTVRGQPVTYKIAGRQYVAVPSGAGGLVVSLVGENPLMTKGSTLVVFALPK
ncbi:MAG: PQQ-dependent dehydrogenase, methanol/ethanol family [Deltaproteobacteria bacterium]|nr:PQQ-dependent dehydrogenase, methanol/ethanol family [Deltaproteobacteria bacterium]